MQGTHNDQPHGQVRVALGIHSGLLGEGKCTRSPFEGAPKQQLRGQGQQDLRGPHKQVRLHVIQVERATPTVGLVEKSRITRSRRRAKASAESPAAKR